MDRGRSPPAQPIHRAPGRQEGQRRKEGKIDYECQVCGPLIHPAHSFLRNRLEATAQPSLDEASQFRGRPELWDWVEFFERRSERVRQAPNRSRLELVVLRIEVVIMDVSSQVLRNFQFALDKRL